MELTRSRPRTIRTAAPKAAPVTSSRIAWLRWEAIAFSAASACPDTARATVGSAASRVSKAFWKAG